MKNYLIVTDTTSAMDKELAAKYGIELVSLSVIIEGQEYKDQQDISTEKLYELLEDDNCNPSTSQPNTGYLTELVEKWKEANYDAIIVITCSSDLSGTWSGFNLVKNQNDMNNMYIYDSRQVGAPVMDMAISAKKMAEEDKDVSEIFEMLEMKTAKSFSFLAPDTFRQLAKGGRLSPMAAKLATVLKIRALLYLKEDGSCVEKYTMTRTDSKIYKTIVKRFVEDNVNSKDYIIYISHANNETNALKIKDLLVGQFGDDMEVRLNALPAVLTCHGGLRCISIHYIHK